MTPPNISSSHFLMELFTDMRQILVLWPLLLIPFMATSCGEEVGSYMLSNLKKQEDIHPEEGAEGEEAEEEG